MSQEFVAGDDYEPDPVFVHSWYEALVIVSLFTFFMFWTVGVSFVTGLEQNYLPANGKPLELVWGMPSWVFYGIFLPWMVVNLIGIWFCFFFMKDDDLDADDFEASARVTSSSDSEEVRG